MSNDINLAVIGCSITVTSTQIAEHFGKQHKAVLRAIDNLDCSPEFALRNFGQGYYTLPETGDQKHRNFSMTRDGFVFLCMGFTGKEAAQWKEKYIAAFNAMEVKLKDRDARSQAVAGSKAVKELPSPDRLTKNLRQRINRKAHEIALKQYDTIHSFITSWASDNLSSGATEEDCERYIETAGELADGTVLMNIRDAQDLVSTVGQVIDTAGSAIATIKRIEQRSGYKFYPRIPRCERLSPDFHKHDRLVQETIDRIVGDPA